MARITQDVFLSESVMWNYTAVAITETIYCDINEGPGLVVQYSVHVCH